MVFYLIALICYLLFDLAGNGPVTKLWGNIL